MSRPVPAMSSGNGPVIDTRVHAAEPDDREPRTRRPSFFFDRFKLLLIIAFVLTLTTMYKSQQSPLMSVGDAVRDQLRAKRWMLVVASLEVLRQVHYLISERNARWHLFWDRKVFGGWDRFMSRRNPWQRFRMQRLVKWLVFLWIAVLIGSWKWGITPLEALAQGTGRMFENLFVNPLASPPLAISIFLSVTFSAFYLIFFYGIFFIGGIDHFKPGEIKTRFADIWGQDHVKDKVAENLDFLNKPAEIEARGGYVPGGLLLWGPPGTGKTLMAEAMAGETGKPFFFVDPGAFVQTFLGVAPMKMKWLYRRLRKQALRHGGVVVFFDEADVLGNRGQLPDDWDRMNDQFDDLRWLSPSGQRAVLEGLTPAEKSSGPEPRRRLVSRIIMAGMGGGGMGTLQAILTEMSGLNKPRGFFSKRIRSFLGFKAKKPPKYRILHVFATNQPNALDQALLRPGRVDRIYKVGYPAKEGRVKTYEGYFRKVTHALTPEQIDRLATITPYATGASIKDLVNESVIVAMKRGSDTVEWVDVLTAKRDKQLGPPENVDYIERERHAIAIHEACHAIAAYRTRQHWMIDLATIEKGGTYLGMVSSVLADDQYTRWKSEYEADIVVSLASLAGEKLFFDEDNSSGVTGDLMSATSLAALMEATWGMGRTIASQQAMQRILGGPAGGPPPSRDEPGTEDETRKAKDPNLGERVELRLQEMFERARRLIEENRLEVLALAHALETHKTISGEDVTAIIEGTLGPTIDGRTYRSELFRTLAESYHAVALQAHKDHAKVDVGLPILVPGGLIPPPPPPVVPAPSNGS